MNWNFDNTQTFEVNTAFTNFQKSYIQGCRNCNEVVSLKDMFKHRQLSGNTYQSLCTCVNCGLPVVFDENKYRLLQSLVNF